MKKVVLAAIAIMACGFVNAQDGGFSKGSVFVSGGFGYSSTEFANVKTTNFAFTPRVGYFASKNIAIGLAVGNNSIKSVNGSNRVAKINEFSVGAFGRYYFTPDSKFSVFGELGFNINSSKNTVTQPFNPDFKSKSNGFGVAFAPGISYFLSKKFAMEATWGILGYESFKEDTPNATTNTAFALGLNLSNINLGLVYKF